MIIIGSDSEIMYFLPSFHFKKGLAKFTIEVRLIRGFHQKGGFFSAKSGCVLYADATYTRVYMVCIKSNYDLCLTYSIQLLLLFSCTTLPQWYYKQEVKYIFYPYPTATPPPHPRWLYLTLISQNNIYLRPYLGLKIFCFFNEIINIIFI